MKKTILFLITLFFCGMVSAQTGLKTKTYHLDNGLKVVLCEDHNQPEIYGAVYVHAGSKNDPSDATGMAHYFEHIMFKGTDRIGTLDWEKESVYLDSISLMYDKLHETSDPARRNAIQHKINELSIASTEYAIPNEVDVILTQMGGENLNAGTAYDQTMFYNTFPSNQLSKWMDVYVERFRNPVFRLFQSELETVYEEKNMYGDSPINAFQELMFKEAFGEHPYGRPIIGYTEHLKNPQPSKMRDFYNTYYVANNMTLILVGDFNIDEVEPLIAEKFGVWRKGEIPPMPKYRMPQFNGATVKEVRMTPIKMGALLFPGIKNSDPDMIPLSIACSIFFNGETGLADKLTNDGELMAAMLIPLSLEDYGANLMLYIPKILGQSHENAESLIFDCLDKLKKGDFSEDLFEAQRMGMLMDRLRATEDLEKLADLFLEMETTGQTYEEFVAETERIKKITKEEVVAVANKYFGNDYIDIRSKMGSAPKDKVEKPDWKPIEAKNTEAKSEFAKMIESEQVPEVTPQVINFGTDVKITDISDGFKLYSAINTANDIFELKFHFNYGTLDDPDLAIASSYFSMQGTEDKTYEEFALELQKLGASLFFSAEDNHFVVTLTGFDSDLEQLLSLCHERLYSPSNEENKIKVLAEGEMANIKTQKDDAATLARAVREYALYGERSTYLNHSSVKEWSKFSGNDLLAKVAKALQYDGYVTYSGGQFPKALVMSINNHRILPLKPLKGEEDIRVEQNFTEPQVFINHNKKFRQSNIWFHVPGEKLSLDDEALSSVFSKYFGTDMYSIVFQEVREFRSLGYTAYSYFNYDWLERKPGNLFGFLGTQSDKTMEGISVMSDLITNMPERREKFNASKEALIKSRASDYITFRDKPSTVQHWIKKGYDHDPRAEVTERIRKAEFSDVIGFYNRNIKDRPVIIMMSGNLKKIDKKELAKYGNITKLKYKQIIKE
ncbi:MAG: insulinase family protein [Bacteroidales bacterium]|nr:insulinase family protein [Bacteroidales bacterium]